MSMTRTALRLATVYALMNQTAAADRVYDSRISDINPEELDEALPVIVVLTDQDEGSQLDRNNGGPPWSRVVDVAIEISMIACERNGHEFTIYTPETDAQLESSLDVIEQQVEEALTQSLSPPSGLFRRLCRIETFKSMRQATDDANVKFAARLITYGCRITIIERPQLQRAPPEVPPTGLDRLPEPLRTVAKELPSGTSGAMIVEAIADAYAPQSAPPLKGIDMTSDLDQADPDNLEIKQNIDLPQ